MNDRWCRRLRSCSASSQPALSLSCCLWSSFLFRLWEWRVYSGQCFTSTASVCAHQAHLRDFWETLPLPHRTLFQAQFAVFWLPSRDLRQIVRGGAGGPVYSPVSLQTAKIKGSSYSSSPYSLFRTQHKSPCKNMTIVLATKKLSWTLFMFKLK